MGMSKGKHQQAKGFSHSLKAFEEKDKKDG